jgi:hypothetical protein
VKGQRRGWAAATSEPGVRQSMPPQTLDRPDREDKLACCADLRCRVCAACGSVQLRLRRGGKVTTEFTVWERHLLSERRLRERNWELALAVGVLALIATGCAAGLAAGWCGLVLPELAWDLLWIGMVSSLAGALGAWREWGHLALLRKLKQRILELESQIETGPKS